MSNNNKSSPFVRAMDSSGSARVTGENGAPAHSNTQDARVDLFFKLVRGLSRDDVRAGCEAVRLQAEKEKDPSIIADLVVLAMQTRAARGVGKGEKDLFFDMFLWLSETYPSTAVALLPYVPEYGYYKDFNLLLDRIHVLREAGQAHEAYMKIEEAIFDLIAEQLKVDKEALEAAAPTSEEGGTPAKRPCLSLAAKWAPK